MYVILQARGKANVINTEEHKAGKGTVSVVKEEEHRAGEEEDTSYGKEACGDT